MTTVGSNLRRLREARGMTQAELAAAANTKQSNVSRYEAGQEQPFLETARRLAEALGCTVDDLLREQP